MGDDPRTSVVNGFGQSHDIRNLFVCDTSVFVTSTGVNPTLTAMALADRSAGYIAAAAGRGDL
jgi:choline dehydrogenase-like flavoprotein